MFMVKPHQVYWSLATFATTLFIFVAIGLSGDVLFDFAALLVLVINLVGISTVSNKPFTLAKMVYIFNAFFFGVVPLNDRVQGNLYWGGAPISEEAFLIAIWLVVISNLLFLFINMTFDKYFSRKQVGFYTIRTSPVMNGPIMLIKAYFLYFLVGFSILYFADFNVLKFFFRGLAEDVDIDSSGSKMLMMFVNYVLKPTPIVMFLLIHWFVTNSNIGLRISKLQLVIFFLVSIFLVFPTSIPRFLAASLYIPLVLVFTQFWKKPYLMCCLILFSLLIVFPFLNNFRRFEANTNLWSIDFDFLNHGHFDAFQNLARSIDLDFYTYGYQLLGSMFFYVPRSLWTSKPFGSGYTLAEKAGLEFSNISMPFVAEGYVNFGIFGALFFVAVLAILLSYFDARFWSTNGNKELGIIFYYLSFGLVFFIMRGDFLSGTAFVFGLYLSYRAVRFFFILR